VDQQTLEIIVTLRNQLVELWKPKQQECEERRSLCDQAQIELSRIRIVDRQIDELRAMP